MRISTSPGTAACQHGKRSVPLTAPSPALCLRWGDAETGPLSPFSFPHQLSGSSPGLGRAKSYPRQRGRGCSPAGWPGQGAAAPAAACSPPLAPRGSC